jgi:hypothetical protein
LRDGAADGTDGAEDPGGEADVLGYPDEGYAGEGDVVDEADCCVGIVSKGSVAL